MRRLSIAVRTGAAAVLAAALALPLAACTGGGTTDDSTPNGNGVATDGNGAGSEGLTLTLGTTQPAQGWDPGDQPSFQNWAAEAVWDQVLKCDALGEAEPDAAEWWEISDDRQSITARLREGMVASDGSELTTADLLAFLEFAQGRANERFDTAEMTVIDDHNFTISWPEANGTIVDDMCNLRLIPAHVLEAGDWSVPVGSGPYILDEANTTAGSVYTFTKNRDHWNADHYPFETLVVRVLQDDTASVSALKTGQIDASLVANAMVAEVEGAGFDVINFNAMSVRLLLSDRGGEVIPALADVRVRQAINMVFDKQAVADNLYLGNATPTAQVFRPGTPAYIEDLEDPYPYDVERARELMAEAGFADGFELPIPTVEGQFHDVLLPYVRQQLSQINIEVTEVPLTGANWIDDLLFSREFPVALWQLGNLPDSAHQIFIEMTPEGWWNLLGPRDEFVMERFDQLAMASEEESARLQQEINQHVIDNAWFAPLVFAGTNFAFNPETVSVPTLSDQEALSPRLRDFQLP